MIKGMELVRPYFTDFNGFGNCTIKQVSKDFIVEEVFKNGELRLCKYFVKHGGKTNIKLGSAEKYLYGELEKKSIETLHAIEKISNVKKIPLESIFYAGMKDKWAITCQTVCIENPNKNICSLVKLDDVVFRPIRWEKEPIMIGDLDGNKFTIVIRGIEKNLNEIRDEVNNFSKISNSGIPNYYGQQRFGGPRSISHIIGKYIFEDRLEDAVILFLTESSKVDSQELMGAREEIKLNKNFKKSLSGFPEDLLYERKIIKHLIKNPGDFKGGFDKININLRRVFVFAFQSFLFNKILEKRVDLLGKEVFKIQKGDVVENEEIIGLVPGYLSNYSEGIQGEIEKEVLSKFGLNFSYFEKVKKYGINCCGSKRPIKLFSSDFKLVRVERDEINIGKNKVTVSFTLKKGQYATVLLEELLKTSLY